LPIRPRRRGRSSAAQRQWAYRQRRKRAVIDAIGNEIGASRTTLLALLAHELATLEGRTAPVNMIGPARNTAWRIMAEIITRHSIELWPGGSSGRDACQRQSTTGNH
jgi:hypothetical protein